jgi:hypothetical protein
MNNVLFGKACWLHDAGKRESLWALPAQCPLSHKKNNAWFGKPCWSHIAGKRESPHGGLYLPTQSLVWFGKACWSHDAGKRESLVSSTFSLSHCRVNKRLI